MKPLNDCINNISSDNDSTKNQNETRKRVRNDNTNNEKFERKRKKIKKENNIDNISEFKEFSENNNNNIIFKNEDYFKLINIFDTSDNIYDISLYKNENIYPTVQCCVCLSICNKPMYVGCSLRHILCYECLNNIYITVNKLNENNSDDEVLPKCPKCREAIDEYDIDDRMENRFAKEIISNLLMKCPNSKIIESKTDDINEDIDITINKEQCNWIGLHKNWLKHNKNDCQYISGTCNNCNIIIYKNEFNKHLNKCCFKCEICQNIFINKIFNKHKIECPELSIPCPLSGECNILLLNKNKLNHINNECIYRIIKCQICNDNIEYKFKDKLIHNKNNELKHLKIKNNLLINENNNYKKIYDKNVFILNNLILNEYEINHNFKIGYKLDVRDNDGRFCLATIIEIHYFDHNIDGNEIKKVKSIKIHYDKWSSKYDELIILTSLNKKRLVRPSLISNRVSKRESMKNITIGDMCQINLSNAYKNRLFHNGWQWCEIKDIWNYHVRLSYNCVYCDNIIHNMGFIHIDSVDEIRLEPK